MSHCVFNLSLLLSVIISARSHNLVARCRLSTCWPWPDSCEGGKCGPVCWVKGTESPWSLPLGSVRRCWGICKGDDAACLQLGARQYAVHVVGYEVQRTGGRHGGHPAPAGRG